ncbi:hypothetical protein [Paenibacillus turpanensis]|uniref:hypothetical protein n=1 Tax=Paenibacillus turpanensis TaxID=2689078 RepID=UPI00140C8F2A|nr:hypothetical protein [Paenibacillus turpanensis]
MRHEGIRRYLFFVVIVAAISALSACSGNNNEQPAASQTELPARTSDAQSIQQINISVINSTKETITNLELKTGNPKYDQTISVPANEQFQTSFPYQMDASSESEIYLTYKDKTQAPQKIRFPKSDWIDHGSIVYVVDIKGVKENHVYEYVFYKTEEDYQNRK